MLLKKKQPTLSNLGNAVTVPQQQWPLEFVGAVAKRIKDYTPDKFVFTPNEVEWVAYRRTADDRQFFYLKVLNVPLLYQAPADNMHDLTNINVAE